MAHRWSPWALSLLALGCAPEFERQSAVKSLRVLAVQKDRPYARPGDTVRLRMLLTDGSEEAPRDVNVSWYAWCENPLGDIYAGCFTSFPAAPGGATGPTGAGGDAGTGPRLQLGQGLDFSFSLSSTILSRRPPPQDPKQPPFGTAFVFFAACAGEVRLEPVDPSNPSFPFGCYSKSGKRLDSDGFVAGYTQIFVYDRMTNTNPLVTGFKVDGFDVPTECIGEACLALEAAELRAAPLDGGSVPPGDAGTADGSDAGDAGVVGVAAPDPCAPLSAACLDVCTKTDRSHCPKHRVELVVDPKSAEADSVSELLQGGTHLEQMWVNYYADQGSFQTCAVPGDPLNCSPSDGVRLLNDATLGWHADHGTHLLPPKTTGPFHVWGVAHDNRGGAEWARMRLVVRDPIAPSL